MLVPFLGLYQPFAALTHLCSAAICLFFGPFLIARGIHDKAVFKSLIVFVSAFVFLFLMSGSYHSFAPGEFRAFFRQLDHGAIWLVIAASFTPPHVILMKKIWRYPFLAFIWGTAIAGVVFKSIYLHVIPGWVGIVLYSAFGCFGVISGRLMIQQYGWHKIQFCYYGAGFYLSGGLFEIWGRANELVIVPGLLRHHEIFHIFVIMGAICHWYWVWTLLGGHKKTP